MNLDLNNKTMNGCQYSNGSVNLRFSHEGMQSGDIIIYTVKVLAIYNYSRDATTYAII